jgi:hypothetical protein
MPQAASRTGEPYRDRDERLLTLGIGYDDDAVMEVAERHDARQFGCWDGAAKREPTTRKPERLTSMK